VLLSGPTYVCWGFCSTGAGRLCFCLGQQACSSCQQPVSCRDGPSVSAESLPHAPNVSLHNTACAPLVLSAVALLTFLNICLLQRSSIFMMTLSGHTSSAVVPCRTSRFHKELLVCYCFAGCCTTVVLLQQSAQPFHTLSAAATQVPCSSQQALLCSQHKTPDRSC
jgi:hypothetical protein